MEPETIAVNGGYDTRAVGRRTMIQGSPQLMPYMETNGTTNITYGNSDHPDVRMKEAFVENPSEDVLLTITKNIGWPPYRNEWSYGWGRSVMYHFSTYAPDWSQSWEWDADRELMGMEPTACADGHVEIVGLKDYNLGYNGYAGWKLHQ
jgi:hypothetical protein